MIRLRGKTALFLAALLLLSAALGSCSVKKKDASRTPSNPMDYMFDEPDHSVTGVRTPLTLMQKTAAEHGRTVNYPFVCDEDMPLLNKSIQSVFMDFAEECEATGVTVSYSAEFNRFGLLSFLLQCRTADGRTIAVDTANFDCDTGRRVFLSDCFGTGSTDYPQRLEELVLHSIETGGGTLLAEGPDITDSTPFLFTFGGMYIVFREYELLSFDAGSPRIKVSVGQLTGYIAQDGLMNRLK